MVEIVIETFVVEIIWKMFARIFSFANFYFVLIIAKIEFSKTFPFLEDCEILDLTHEFSNETKYWTEKDKFKLDTVFKGFRQIF